MHGADVSCFPGKLRPALPQKSLWYGEAQPDVREIERRMGLGYFPVLALGPGCRLAKHGHQLAWESR